jgi:hypothetical protein
MSISMILALCVSCMGTYKKSICLEANRIDNPKIVGNFYRQLPNGRKLKTVVEKKEGSDLGVYQLTRFFDKEETASNTTELRLCKIDDQLFAEYQMLEGWLRSERYELTFSYVDFSVNNFNLSAINYYEFVNDQGVKTTGTLDNSEMTAQETMAAFKIMAPIMVTRIESSSDANWEFTNNDMNAMFDKFLEGK